MPPFDDDDDSREYLGPDEFDDAVFEAVESKPLKHRPLPP